MLEGWVPTSFRRERVKGRVRRCIKERPNNPNLAEVLAQNRGALRGADLTDLDLLVVSPATEGRSTCGANIPNPAHLTVGAD